MITTMTIRRLFSRAAATLVLMLLTTMAWAATSTVSYIDENGMTQTVSTTVYSPNANIGTSGATMWYVV